MATIPIAEAQAKSTDHTKAQDPTVGSRPLQDPMIAPQRIGKYEILCEIGEGGMGRVYKALDPELKRLVAIKVLKPNTGVDEIVRFRGEAEQIAMIEHVNIIKVFDIAMAPSSQPYIVLEYIDGGTLESLIRKQLPKPRQAAEMTATLSRAMQAAHDKNIIHRDLKPANVLLTHSGTPKVTDFGLGKRLEDSSNRTQSGAVFGTPAYMAPEQASGDGKAATPATDIYALGAILYEMLTGRPPFAGAGIVDLLTQVQFTDPVSPTMLVNKLPRDISTICLKCLEKSPKARYATANDLAADLTRWLNSEPILARSTPWHERLWRRIRRRPKEALIAASVFFAVGALIGLLWALDKRHAEKVETQKQNDLKQTFFDQQQADAVANFERIRKRNKAALNALDCIRELAFGEDFDDAVQAMMRERLANSYHELASQDQDDRVKAPKELANEFLILADLFKKAGNRKQASNEYRLAVDYYTKSLSGSQSPEDTLWLGSARTEIGRAQCELGEYEKATGTLSAALNEFRSLHESSPASIPYEAGLAEVLHMLGECRNNLQQCDDSIQAFQQSIAHRKAIVVRYRPSSDDSTDLDYLRNLGRGYGYLGDVFLKQQKHLEADIAYRESHAARQSVVEKAKKLKRTREYAEARFQLARSFANFANYQIRNRAHATAQYFLNEAEILRKEIADERTSSIDFKIDLAGNFNARAELCLMMLNESTKAEMQNDAGEYLKHSARICDEIERKKGQSVAALNARAAMILNEARLRLSINPRHPGIEESKAILATLANPRQPLQHYMCAAAYALQGQSDQSLEQLRKARGTEGFRDRHPDDILNDLAFQSIRNHAGFEHFVREILPQADPQGR